MIWFIPKEFFLKYYRLLRIPNLGTLQPERPLGFRRFRFPGRSLLNRFPISFRFGFSHFSRR